MKERSSNINWFIWFLLITVCCSSVFAQTYTGTVDVAWNLVNHEDLVGYKVYWGINQPGDTSNSVDVEAPATTVHLTSIRDCTPIYIAVKAYDAEGNISEDFSNTVNGWARPRIDSIDKTELTQGESYMLIIDGMNFKPGSTMRDDIGLQWEMPGGIECDQFMPIVTIPVDAPIGQTTISVVHPDMVVSQPYPITILEGIVEGLPIPTNVIITDLPDALNYPVTMDMIDFNTPDRYIRLGVALEGEMPPAIWTPDEPWDNFDYGEITGSIDVPDCGPYNVYARTCDNVQDAYDTCSDWSEPATLGGQQGPFYPGATECQSEIIMTIPDNVRRTQL